MRILSSRIEKRQRNFWKLIYSASISQVFMKMGSLDKNDRSSLLSPHTHDQLRSKYDVFGNSPVSLVCAMFTKLVSLACLISWSHLASEEEGHGIKVWAGEPVNAREILRRQTYDLVYSNPKWTEWPEFLYKHSWYISLPVPLPF